MTRPPNGLSAFNRSIRMQLILGTVIILTAVIILLTTLIARNATRLLEEQTTVQLDQLATQSARAVTDFLDARTATVDLWSADTLLLSVVRDPSLAAVFMPGLRSYLGNYADREPWIGNVIVTRGDDAVFGLYPEHLELQNSAVLARAPTETTLLEGTQDRPPYLAIRRQARDRGQEVEDVFVTLLLDLEVVQQRLLSDAGLSEDGFAALLGPEGHAMMATPVPLGLAPDFVPGQQILSNDRFLIQTRTVRGTPLSVVWVAARSDFEAPVRRLVFAAAILGSAAILLGLVGMIYFTGRVTAPIRRLTQDARREAMARFGSDTIDARAGEVLGTFEPKRQITAGYGADEIGELATVFELLGRTTDELTETNARLESRNRDLSDTRTRLRENLDRLERELNSARKLQLSMVPPPDAGKSLGSNVAVNALMEPAREVGGDFYDFFNVDDNHVCVLIGDVSDKGTPSALFMARTISLVRFSTTQIARLSHHVPSPSEVLTEVNGELCKANTTRMFVTLFLAILDRRTGQVTYANAGHPSPVFSTATDIASLSLAHPDLPLGVRQNLSYKQHQFQMQSHDKLILYTDGVTEAENNANHFYGLDRLIQCLDRATDDAETHNLIERIRDDITVFADGAEQFDDITMLVLGWTPTRQD